MSFIQAKDIKKIYQIGDVKVDALKGVSFDIEEGEFVTILGKSGAGKSTLLNILGGMDSATSGSLIVGGRTVTGLNDRQLGIYRRNDIGFVFQFYNLMPNLTCLENIKLASDVVERPFKSRDALRAVGLENRANNFPGQISGGEQQRVSIARAIVKDPKLLLCDEPTGALDSNTGKSICKLLLQINKATKKTIVVVTHNSEIAKLGDRVIRVHDGAIKENVLQNRMSVEELQW